MPKVSVVMTLFNSEPFIGAAIGSVLGQTYSDYEIVVVDDGSTDGSAAIVKSFGERVRYVHQPNRGCAHATNHGVALSSGEYVAFLENDDVWLPQKLERQVAVLDLTPDVGAVNCDLQYVTEEGVIEEDWIQGRVPHDPYSRVFLKGFNFMLSALMLRRTAFEKTGGFFEGFRAAGLQDVEWYARLMDITTAHHIPEALALFRRHGHRIASKTRVRNEDILLERLLIRFRQDSRKRRYILSRRVAFLSNQGKAQIDKGRIEEGRKELRAAVRLGLGARVGAKMVVRSLLRLARSVG